MKSEYKAVDLRSEPSDGATVVEHVPGGLEVVKVAEDNGWVKISLDMDDGSKLEGWLSKKVVNDPHPQAEPQPKAVRVKSQYKTVDLRSEPTVKASVVEHVPGGMEILEVSENAQWVQVKLDMDDGSQLEGWIDKKYIQ